MKQETVGQKDSGRLMFSRLERDVVSPQAPLPSRVALWLFAIRSFRDLEETWELTSQRETQETQQHRSMLVSLLALGENLLLETDERNDPELSLIQVSCADLAACVQMLRDDYAMAYGGMTETRRKEVMTEVFGVES